jgi:dCMP deaminase
VYQNGYRDDSGIQFLIKAGVEVEQILVLEQ